MIDIIVQQYEKYKYIELDKDPNAIEFMKQSNVDLSDAFERIEALAFYYGCKTGMEIR